MRTHFLIHDDNVELDSLPSFLFGFHRKGREGASDVCHGGQHVIAVRKQDQLQILK